MMKILDIPEARDRHHVYALLEAQVQRQTWEPHKQHPHEGQHSGEGPRKNTWVFVDKCLASGYLDSISSKTGLLREGRQLTKGIKWSCAPRSNIWPLGFHFSLCKMEACENTNNHQHKYHLPLPDNCGSSSTRRKDCSG